MKTIQLDALHRHNINPDELLNLEDLIESLAELGGFKVSKVMDGEKETGLYTMELIE